MRVDLDILHDAFVYLGNLSRDPSLIRNDMFLIPDSFFADVHNMMRNFALDIFLGVHSYETSLKSQRMGSLGRFVSRIRRRIPQTYLKERENELKSL